MTVSSTSRKAGPYSGNDVVTKFPFDFTVFAADEMLVIHTDAAGIESALVLTSDYSVLLNSDQDADPGGEVTLVAPLPTGELITLTSVLAYLQSLDLTNLGAFYPDVIERALDKATIQIQQLAEQAARSVQVPISDPRTPADYWQDLFVAADAAAQAAAASAAAAHNSEQAAALSEDNAHDSEVAAATSEAAAFASKTAAGLSENAAADSEYASAQSETNAAASEQAAALSEDSAAVSAQESLVSAIRSENAADAATEPVAAMVAQYLDNFIPTGTLVSFSAIYTPGGFDLGTLAQAAPFPNEDAAMRRASMSAGSGTFDYGLLA